MTHAMNTIRIYLQTNRKPLFTGITALLCLAGLVFSAGCAQTPLTASPSPGPTRQGVSTTAPYLPPATQDPDGASQQPVTPEGQTGESATRPVPTLPGALNRVELTVLAPVSGEVPGSLLAQIVQDLSERLGIESEKIEFVRAEAVVWNDGSLGCPQPGMFYTQALVNGYWVILEVDSIAYDYRASDRGYFTLCERSSLPALATPSR